MKATRRIVVAIAGNPNSGKTTIFNALTGSNQHVGNYPGVTVEKRECITQCEDYVLHILDLPGTYSLNAYSAEEIVTRDFIINEKPDVIIQVLDSTNLERHLYLCLQFQELGIPIVAALNMSDEAAHKGITIDAENLSRILDIPMVKTVGIKRKGLDELLSLAIRTAQADKKEIVRINYGRETEEELCKLDTALQADQEFVAKINTRWLSVKLLEKDPHARERIATHRDAEKLRVITDSAITGLEKHFNEKSDAIIAEQRYAYIHGAIRETVTTKFDNGVATTTDRIDALLLNKTLGLPLFILIIWGIFQLTFTLSVWPMNGLDALFSWLGKSISSIMPNSILRSLIVDGVIGGVGGMLVFIPNIILLFLCISFLEDSGYMARAAFIMDKVMHKIGLHGQSFIPLMIGFGCSVPAIMGARTLRSDKDRITTILITPLMSCGAKLPVYTLLISAFFSPKVSGNILFSIYLIGILLAIAMAFLFRKFLFKGKSSPFVMELPPYRMPTFRGILRHIGEKTTLYLKKAGTIILAASVIIWFLTNFPKPADTTSNANTLLEQSYAGKMGKLMDPVLQPIGFNWKIGIALITGLAAKETVVSTLATIYKVGSDEGGSLRTELKKDKQLNPLVAYCVMLFILIYVPCLSTLAVIKQELGSFKWVWFSLIYSTGLAWLVAFFVYQAGKALGVGV